jgi:hypothetical protein
MIHKWEKVAVEYLWCYDEQVIDAGCLTGSLRRRILKDHGANGSGGPGWKKHEENRDDKEWFAFQSLAHNFPESIKYLLGNLNNLL